MKYTPKFPKPGKKRKTKADETFRFLYRTIPCLLCESPDTMYCHFPRHRGSGGRGITWEYDKGIPGCYRCHRLIDGTLGVSEKIQTEQADALMRLAVIAPEFWERIRIEHGL